MRNAERTAMGCPNRRSGSNDRSVLEVFPDHSTPKSHVEALHIICAVESHIQLNYKPGQRIEGLRGGKSRGAALSPEFSCATQVVAARPGQISGGGSIGASRPQLVHVTDRVSGAKTTQAPKDPRRSFSSAGGGGGGMAMLAAQITKMGQGNRRAAGSLMSVPTAELVIASRGLRFHLSRPVFRYLSIPSRGLCGSPRLLHLPAMVRTPRAAQLPSSTMRPVRRTLSA